MVKADEAREYARRSVREEGGADQRLIGRSLGWRERASRRSCERALDQIRDREKLTFDSGLLPGSLKQGAAERAGFISTEKALRSATAVWRGVMATDLREVARALFKTADNLWTNTALGPDEYAQPVLALIALRQMEARFEVVHAELGNRTGRLAPRPEDYQARGAPYLPEFARFSRLLALPGNADLGAALNGAMQAVADANPDLAGVLPNGYAGLPSSVLAELLRLLAPLKIEGDAYGLIFEYFMGEFAPNNLQKGGEFYTPASIVALIVEIIEPHEGRILDPACSSGGMFVHSADFVRRHNAKPERAITLHGVEKRASTGRLCRLNLAVHGLSGKIREANAYYDDPHKLVGRFDRVMANPPFNQKEVDVAKLRSEAGVVDARFPFGLPTVNNANYLWIGLFYAALNERGG